MQDLESASVTSERARSSFSSSYRASSPEASDHSRAEAAYLNNDRPYLACRSHPPTHLSRSSDTRKGHESISAGRSDSTPLKVLQAETRGAYHDQSTWYLDRSRSARAPLDRPTDAPPAKCHPVAWTGADPEKLR